MATYSITLTLEIAESRRSPNDTHRRAREAAAKITAYADRLRFVEVKPPAALVPVIAKPELEEIAPDA